MRERRIDRRALLLGTGGAMATAALPGGAAFARAGDAQPEPHRRFELTTGKGQANLVGDGNPATAVWAFNGMVPGPEIRVRQGDRLQIRVKNQLDEGTSVHWHGLRVPNGMDGVPHLTQKPIPAGGTFVYDFAVPDAGTYWYHPHQSSSEQVGRGLYGAFVIEEREPIAVDRDVTWVLDDWRLGRDAQIVAGFGNMMDASHAGRIGNTVTVNGTIAETFNVKAGERIRLRLINVANARIFGLEFSGHKPKVIALDGQPVEPHDLPSNRIVLGPAMRADLIIDMTGEAGRRYTVTDTFYRQQAYRLLDFVYDGKPLRDRPPQTPIALAPNTMPEPDLNTALRHEIVFNGGMMGGMMMGRGGGMMGGGMNMRAMMESGRMWLINGVAATGHVMSPMLTLQRGRTIVLAMSNETAWWHPIHLHGHSFRLLSRNRRPTRHREWLDTVLMAPRDTVEVAFVADNPGDWMFHCHILEHQAAGMMGVVRVA
jgi:FtsP/CotA-like multicopper oxidase with cupredoxin domain